MNRDETWTRSVYLCFDTHRETIHGTAIDKNGEVMRSENFRNTKEALHEFMKEFPTWNTVIAIEACNFWRGCYKILKEMGYTIKLANPVTCHKIAHEKKTDKVDSKILADLELKNYEINSYLELYRTIQKEEQTIKNKIDKIAKAKEETALLETIPGIGYFGAALIYAEIGDVHRFPTVKHLHAYAGVAPGIYQSGTKTRMPSRKSVNYWLKWIVIQCRLTLKNTKASKLRSYYFKVKNKKGWKTARKATARRLLTVIWYVLHNKNPYRES